MKYILYSFILIFVSCSSDQKIRCVLKKELGACEQLLNQGKRKDLLIRLNEIESKYSSYTIWDEYSDSFNQLKPIKSKFKQ